MQQVTALQAVEMYGVFTDKTKHTWIAYCKGRADSNSPVRLPCPAVITCQRHYEPNAIECSTQWQCILKACKAKVCMLSICSCCTKCSALTLRPSCAVAAKA